MKKLKLEIENKPKLLTQYGLSVALISTVENLLLSAIATKKCLPPLEVKKKLYGKSLGVIITSAKGFLDQNFIERMNKLNKKRIFLVHGLIIKKRIFHKNNEGKTDVSDFTLEELKGIEKEARDIGTELLKICVNLIK